MNVKNAKAIPAQVSTTRKAESPRFPNYGEGKLQLTTKRVKDNTMTRMVSTRGDKEVVTTVETIPVLVELFDSIPLQTLRERLGSDDLVSLFSIVGKLQ